MSVSLSYGTSRVELSLRSEFVAQTLRLEHSRAERAAEKTGQDRVQNALDELAEAEFFEQLAEKKLGLLISDATRSESREAVLKPLFSRLRGAAGVWICLCTGTHDPNLPENTALRRRVEAWADEILPVSARGSNPTVRVEVHDARRGEFCSHGTTSRGTPVEINASAQDCDLFLVVSDLKTHYFAGYSNPIKNYLPGIAALESVRANHAFALHQDATLGRHPWHPDPTRRTNPIAEDMLEALELVVGARPHYALCTLGGPAGIEWAAGGATRSVTARGLLEVDRTRILRVEPQRYLLVSAGGHPLDESLYTAQRALELTRAGLLPGGEVLFLAQCANGIGPPSSRENFFERLQAPLAEVLKLREQAEDYVLYSHKAWKFADYIARSGRVSLLSELSQQAVRSIHLDPVDRSGAQAVVDRWQREARSGDRVLVVDDASKLALC